VLVLAFGIGQPPPRPVGFRLRPRLTPRQRKILDLIASGLSTSEIADEHTLSTKTVRNHLSNVLSKLQVADRAEAIIKAREAGLA